MINLAEDVQAYLNWWSSNTDEWKLKDNESLHASIVGMWLIICIGAEPVDAFEISLNGASSLRFLKDTLNLVENIDESIVCQL